LHISVNSAERRRRGNKRDASLGPLDLHVCKVCASSVRDYFRQIVD